MQQLDYKGYVLLTTEIPNFNSAGLVKDSKLYRGSSTINSEKWVRDGSSIDILTQWFKAKVDSLKRQMTYEEVCQQWRDRSWTKIEYKGKSLYLDATKRIKDDKVIYTGGFYTGKGSYVGKHIRRESIHCHKIITKFKRYVDEYCTDWRPYSIWGSSFLSYNGYNLTFKKEYGVENYIGTCNIHSYSTFKYMSNSLKEIEEKFKARIDQILRHKQGIKMIAPKEDRVKQLEAQIAKLQQEIEKVKKEKETLTYKGVILEYGPDPAIRDGWMAGRIKDAPIEAETFYTMYPANMKDYFETYIDNLEKSAKIYCQLMGLEYKEVTF